VDVSASDLTELLTLERLEEDLFRGRNGRPSPRETLYGGQVAAQCLLAASATVEAGRMPHSFHGYFLRPGRADIAVVMRVDRDRDGRSFSARHVVAIQEGAVIFSMVASFHHERPGPTYDAAPRREAPVPAAVPEQMGWNPMIEVVGVTPADPATGRFPDCMWVRSASALPDDPLIHAGALAYLSDLGTGFGQLSAELRGRGGPSIDHAMWFQAPIKADQWVMLDLVAVKAWAARGTYHGSMRDAAGTLGATIYQEHLMLPMEPPA
jgi:acyl-CoA thioesterase-2